MMELIFLAMATKRIVLYVVRYSNKSVDFLDITIKRHNSSPGYENSRQSPPSCVSPGQKNIIVKDYGIDSKHYFIRIWFLVVSITNVSSLHDDVSTLLSVAFLAVEEHFRRALGADKYEMLRKNRNLS